MLAIFDLDGFLYDFESYLVTVLERKHGFFARANRDVYDLRDRFENFQDIYKDAVTVLNNKHVYGHLNVDPFARQFVIQTIERGYEVMFLTSRPVSTKKITEKSLEKVFGELYTETYGVEFTQSKVSYIEPFKKTVAFVVDDNPEEVENLNNIEVKAFAWNQPWNEHVYPNIQPDREGEIWLRPSNHEDGDYFWNYME